MTNVVNRCNHCGKPLAPVTYVNVKPVVTHLACAIAALAEARNKRKGK